MLEKYVKIDYILAMMLYFIAFLRMPFSYYYNKVKILILIFAIAYCLFYSKSIDAKYKKINTVLAIFGAWTVLASYINRFNVVTSNPFSASLFFSSALICIFISLEILVVRIGYAKIIDAFFYTSLCVVLALDFCVFTGAFIHHNTGILVYPVGSKFAVMYQHLIFLWLLLDKLKNYTNVKRVMYIYILYSALVGLRVDCVTGIVGLVFFVVFINVFRKWIKLATRPIIALGVELLAFSYVFFGYLVMSNDFVLSILNNYMGGSETMLSRVNIYGWAFPMIAMSPIIGFGYGTTYELGIKWGGFSDTQNSLYEWAWYAGWPAVVLVCCSIVVAFRIIKKDYDNDEHVGMYIMALFYVYILLGAVEILMELPFFSILAMAMISTNKLVDRKS